MKKKRKSIFDIKTIKFRESIKITQGERRHLLIGNGFSISLFHNIFSYKSLLETADLTKYPQIEKAFDVLKTTNFEFVIQALRFSSALLPLYVEDKNAKKVMREHIEVLKELLVKTIADSHPNLPSEIDEKQYSSCRKFLKHFIGANKKNENKVGQVYTLNYDLLLYWTLLHEERKENEKERELICDDGFRTPEEDLESEYVTWEGESNYKQNIHYIHGALHLFDNGPNLEKCCWERSGGIPLVKQIRNALENEKYPLFVSEGDSRSKLTRIRHYGYLQRSLKSFSNIDNNLFVFGFSFTKNDEHILRKIETGKIKKLFVSLYGDPQEDNNQNIIKRVFAIKEARPPRKPLDVFFFDAKSVNLWGKDR